MAPSGPNHPTRTIPSAPNTAAHEALRDRCEAVGRRIASDLRRVLGHWPAHARSLRALAEFLGLDRNVCQRAFAASRPELSGLEVLIKLPGLGPLRQLLEQSKSKGCDRRATASLEHAILQVEELIEATQGRATTLRAFVTSQIQAVHHGEDADQIEKRRSCFDAMTDILGVRVGLFYTIGILYPWPDDPGMVEVSSLRAFIETSRRPGGLPLSSTCFRLATADLQSDEQATSLEHEPAHLDFGSSVLREFCDPPNIATSSHPAPNGASTLVIDAPVLPAGPSTAVLASRLGPHPHPLIKPDDGHHCIVRVAHPTAQLIIDAYLPRSLAGYCQVRPLALITNPAGLVDPGENWYEHIPAHTRIELITDDQPDAAPAIRSAGRNLTERYFQLLNRDRADFVGYRLRIPYPLHNALYMISFQRVGSADQPDTAAPPNP